MLPRVSVILPLYNKARFVRRSLDSIRAQTFEDYEAIVVDDGSTDGGPEIVHRFDDPRFRLISQKNAGPGAARNRGLSESAGEFVAFLDADDAWRPRFLERGLAELESHGAQVACVSSGYALHPPGESMAAMWRRRGLGEDVHELMPDTCARLVVFLLAYLQPQTTLARTQVLRRHGGFFDQSRCLYGEDAYLWLKVLLNERVAIHFEPLADIYADASELCRNLRGARPVEPLLTHPRGLIESCPERLRPLLHDILALRAMKTANMLSYWGQWREARKLLAEFASPKSSPGNYVISQLAATPIGAGAGWMLRQLRGAAPKTVDKGLPMQNAPPFSEPGRVAPIGPIELAIPLRAEGPISAMRLHAAPEGSVPPVPSPAEWERFPDADAMRR